MASEQSREGERAEVCLAAVSDRAVTAVMPLGNLTRHRTMNRFLRHAASWSTSPCRIAVNHVRPA
jgi:hypothetical protein